VGRTLLSVAFDLEGLLLQLQLQLQLLLQLLLLLQLQLLLLLLLQLPLLLLLLLPLQLQLRLILSFRLINFVLIRPASCPEAKSEAADKSVRPTLESRL
jgi:hypothetical protein